MENRLRVLRAERDWSQQDLAERLEVSRQSVNAIETGKYDPSLPLAFRIAELFDAADRGHFRVAVAPQLESHLTPPTIKENCHAHFRTDPCRLAASTLNWSARRTRAAAAAEQRLPPHLGPSVGKGSPIVLIPGLLAARGVGRHRRRSSRQGTKSSWSRSTALAATMPGQSRPGCSPGSSPTCTAISPPTSSAPARHRPFDGRAIATLMFAKAHPEEVEPADGRRRAALLGVLLDPSPRVDAVKPMAEMMRAKVASAMASRRSRAAPRRTSNRSRSSRKHRRMKLGRGGRPARHRRGAVRGYDHGYSRPS